MKKCIVSLAFLFVLSSFAVSAQALVPTENKPTADGIVSPGEYSVEGVYNGMKLGASLSSDGKTAFFALEAPSTGWVAVGLGSLRMNGAFMVLGFDAKGTPSVSEETGKGHSHKKNDVQILTSSAVREASGSTVLEFSLPAAGFIQGKSLQMIVAYGKADNFNSFHSKYAPIELQLSK